MRHLIHLRDALLFCTPAAIILSGCAAAKPDAPFQPVRAESYEADAVLEYGEGQSAALHLTRCGNALWDASFTEPAALAGVILTFDGNMVSASYKGLAFSVPKSALPAKNMLLMATETLDAAQAAETLPCAQQEDGSFCAQGECAGGSYTLTFDAAGQPVCFEVPSQPLRLTFSGFTVLQETAVTATTVQTAGTGSAEASAVTTESEAKNKDTSE